MEIIKRKILLENSIDRGYDSPTYGTLTATSFYVNVMLTQDMDDMGMFTDIIYLPNFPNQNTPVDYTILINKLQSSGITFPFMSGVLPTSAPMVEVWDVRATGKTLSDYYNYTNTIVSGNTESRLEDVKSYNATQRYQAGFDITNTGYTNYLGVTVNGVDRVTKLGDPIVYVFDADKNDSNIGNTTQKNGLVFNDYTAGTTTISYIGEGWNATNISLSAITKEEYLFGIISSPEVKSDVFIDRGITTVFEKHLKLSEITNLSELERYGNGFYNLTKY